VANREKLLRRLLSRPTDMRFSEIELLLQDVGYELKKSKGSHRRFEMPGRPMIVVPVSDQRVTRVYLADLIRLLGLEERDDESN
jgi:predicted RNA binding protein YcfA (HicA-like mRNA interferase family)